MNLNIHNLYAISRRSADFKLFSLYVTHNWLTLQEGSVQKEMKTKVTRFSLLKRCFYFHEIRVCFAGKSSPRYFLLARWYYYTVITGNMIEADSIQCGTNRVFANIIFQLFHFINLLYINVK